MPMMPATTRLMGPAATASTVPMPAITGKAAAAAPMAVPMVPMAETTPAITGSATTRPARPAPITVMPVARPGLAATQEAIPSAIGVMISAIRVSGGRRALPTAMPSRWAEFWKLVSVPWKVARLRWKSLSTVPAAADPPASAFSFSYSLRYFIRDIRASLASLSPKIWLSLKMSPPVTFCS